MSDKFTFSSAGEIQEVEFALARHGWTHSLLKRATGGDFFGLIREVLEGRVEICRIERLTHGELSVSEPTRSWREEDGVIYFSVTSDGTTGENWIPRLESKGFSVGGSAKQVLRSPDFKPTSGVTTEVAVLKGMLFEDNNRITKKIRAEADKRKLTKPNAEVACLIREKFADKELEAMGLWWIVAMHEPIKDSDGDPSLLNAGRVGDGRRLNACSDRPGSRWDRDGGFAFAVSQVCSQN